MFVPALEAKGGCPNYRGCSHVGNSEYGSMFTAWL
jgi:hypothetical protein